VSKIILGHSQNHLAVAGGYVVDMLRALHKKSAIPPTAVGGFIQVLSIKLIV
jgi:hypothetical protein